MADPYKISITIEAQTEEAKSNIDRLNGEFGKFLRTLGKSPDDIKIFSRLAQDMLATGKVTEDVDKETRQLLHTYKTLLEVAKSRDILDIVPHSEISRRIEEVKRAFETLKNSGFLSQREIAQAALVANQKINELKKEANGLIEALDKARNQFIQLAGAAGGLTLMVKQAIDFESAMADVAKTTNLSGEELKKLGDEIITLTSKIPMTADELAKIASIGGQLGIASKDLKTFIELAAKLGTAFNMSAEDASQAVAKMANIFGISITEVEKLSDAINVLGNNTAATEKDIIETVTRIGGVARQFGLAAEQAAALADAMLSIGRSPEVAATGINALLTKLQTARESSDDFKEALRRVGLGADQLAESIRANPQRALLEFLRTLQKIEPMARSELLVKLFGLEYQDDIGALIAAISQYEKALDLIGNRQKVAGATQNEFNERIKTTQAQLQILRNAFEAVAIHVGSTFLPAISKMAQSAAEIARAVDEFSKAHPAIAGLSTLLATLVVSVGALRTAFLAVQFIGVNFATATADKIKIMNQSLMDAVRAVGSLQASFSALSVAVMGWEIGTWLSEKFDVVRKAGVLMVWALVTGFEEIRYQWELLEAVFTSDTADEAAKRHIKRLEDIRNIMTGLWKEAETETKRSAENIVKDTQQAVEAARQAAEAASGSVVITADQVIKQFEKLADEAKRGKDAIEKIFSLLNDGVPITGQVVEQVVRSIEYLSSTSRDAGNAIQQHIGDAISKLSNVVLMDFIAQTQVTFKRLGSESENVAKLFDVSISEAVKRLGVSLEALRTGVDRTFSEILQLFDTVAQSGRVTAEELNKILKSLIVKADTTEEIEQLRKRIELLGQSGSISKEQLENLFRTIELRSREASLAVSPIEEAFKTLGLKSSEALQLAADRAKAAFEAIRSSATASTGDIERAFIAYAQAAVEAAEAAGASQKDATQSLLRSQAAALGLYDALKRAGLSGLETGDHIAKGMQAAKEATDDLSSKAREAADAVSETGEKTEETSKRAEEGVRAFASALASIINEYKSVYEETTRLVENMIKNTVGLLGDEIADSIDVAKLGVHNLNDALESMSAIGEKLADYWTWVHYLSDGSYNIAATVQSQVYEMYNAVVQYVDRIKEKSLGLLSLVESLREQYARLTGDELTALMIERERQIKDLEKQYGALKNTSEYREALELINATYLEKLKELKEKLARTPDAVSVSVKDVEAEINKMMKALGDGVKNWGSSLTTTLDKIEKTASKIASSAYVFSGRSQTYMELGGTRYGVETTHLNVTASPVININVKSSINDIDWRDVFERYIYPRLRDATRRAT